MEMHDVIAVRDFGEVERLVLAAQAHQPFLLPQRPHRLIAAENFRVAQDDQLARRPDEAAQEGALKEGDRFIRDARLAENFLEPLLLPLVVAEDRHFPALGQPVAQMIEKKIAAIFLQDEVAARGVEKIVGEERQW